MNNENVKLLLVKGLPASGKSTYAKAWVDADSDLRARVNRDDIRFQLFGKYSGLSRHQEDSVTILEDASVKLLLDSGVSVVVDAMHLKASYVKRWYDLADVVGNVDVEVVDFDTPLEVCIERDSKREKKVGEEVIRDIHKRFFKKGRMPETPVRETKEVSGRIYIPDETKPQAYMFDIDGTLADMGPCGRGPYDEHRVGEDIVHEHVAESLRALWHAGYEIVIMSGRTDGCRKETVEWLMDNKIPFNKLLMRSSGDQRKDSDIKEELFFAHVANNYNVLAVFDDRNQVVDRWREIGLPCFQVAPGPF